MVSVHISSGVKVVSVAESLYRKFELKRVFYSAFVNVTGDSNLPALPGGPPMLREHRLYQADWLLRFYGFRADELLDEGRPFFNVLLDPKEHAVAAKPHPLLLAGEVPDDIVLLHFHRIHHSAVTGDKIARILWREFLPRSTLHMRKKGTIRTPVSL